MITYQIKAIQRKILNIWGKLSSVKTELKPTKDIEKLSCDTWLSLSDDPHFLVKTPKLKKGWYLLYIDLGINQFQTAKLYPSFTSRKTTEKDSIEFPLKPLKATTRFFYIDSDIKHLLFSPMENSGEFSVNTFRLVKVPAFYARRRQLTRIYNLHHKYHNTNPKSVKLKLAKHAKAEDMTLQTFTQKTYNETFSKQDNKKSYQQWITKTEKPKLQKYLNTISYSGENKPTFLILIRTYNTSPEHLKQCLQSVLNQTYDYWKVQILDQESTKKEHIKIINTYVDRDKRIALSKQQNNDPHLIKNNEALQLGVEDLTLFLDPNDQLSPHALQITADSFKKNPRAKLIYTDEDKIDESGLRFMPHFKPDWNQDLLYSQNYIGSSVFYKTKLIYGIKNFNIYSTPTQNYDLLLRYTHGLKREEIIHLPWILYHSRTSYTSQSVSKKESKADTRVLQSFYDENLSGVMVKSINEQPGIYRCTWPLPEKPPLVSLIIPTRDGYAILKTCVDSILEKTTYTNYEILILNNQSKCKKTINYLNQLNTMNNVRVLDWNKAFNYSEINNFGVSQAFGEVIGLVNNDIEVINPSWLTEMVSHTIRPEIGCVGAKLYFPNNTIQHAGVILGLGGGAGHAHKHFSRHDKGYFNRLISVQNYSAVTAACLLIRTSTFKEVGGLNEEHLTIAFNDVDLCLKVNEQGYRNLFTPWAELYHHESISRGAEDTPFKQKRANKEVSYLRRNWPQYISHDPAYNRNLTLTSENFSLK